MTCGNCRMDAAVQKFNLEKFKQFGDQHVPYEMGEGEGHDGCKGCTCQHLPVGSVEFLGSDPSRSA
jgi:hypothetical protein